MAYNKAHENINWQNLPSEATALNAINFNKMDNSIDVIDDRVIALDTARINDEASLANKVDKVEGKGLSTNDYTTTEKNKLAGIEAGAQVNTVTGVKGNSEGSYRTGNVNITKANIGLGNVDNTSDANKPVSTAAQAALGNKVDKVAGKGLSTNDYTDAEKTKLAGIETGANKTIVDSSLSGSSTNPVQNKVAKSALDGKVDKVTNYGLSLYKDIGYYQTAEGQTGTYIGYVGGKNQNGQLQALGDIYNGVVVDSALSSSSTNPVENKAIYDALNNLLPSKTVSGNPISISDASGLNAKSLTVSMNPIQDLHGYDYPWVGGAGKNKVNATVKGQTTGNGITGECFADNRFVLSGTSTGNGDFVTNCTPFTIPSGTTYTISIHGDLTLSSNALYLYYGGKNTNFTASTKERTTTATEDITISNLRFRCFAGTTVSADFKLQIEIGSTATSYAPYSNICPISGRTEVKVQRNGVNQWDEEWESGSINNSTGQNQNAGTNSIRSKNYIPVFPQTSYYFYNSSGVNCFIYYYKADQTFIGMEPGGSGLANVAFTTPAECYFVRFRSNDNYGTTYGNNISVNYPSTDTNYHAYTAETHTIEFGQTVYGGTLDLTNGKLTIDTGMVDLGSLTWTYDATYNRFSSNGILDAKVPQTARTTAFLCSCYEVISDGRPISQVTNNSIYQAYGGGGAYATLCINDDRFTDPTDLVNAISGQTATYELKNPTTISTSAEEIELLKGQNVLSTNADDMELKYSVSLDSLLPT